MTRDEIHHSGWEEAHWDRDSDYRVLRMAVPCGWLYRLIKGEDYESVCFVPDPGRRG
jgi:hypothetical protein